VIGIVSLAACFVPAVVFAMPFTMAVYGATYAMLARDAGYAASDKPRWCWNCGYDMSGLTLGRCPECGQEPRL
jgi:hypothetical protein